MDKILCLDLRWALYVLFCLKVALCGQMWQTNTLPHSLRWVLRYLYSMYLTEQAGQKYRTFPFSSIRLVSASIKLSLFSSTIGCSKDWFTFTLSIEDRVRFQSSSERFSMQSSRLKSFTSMKSERNFFDWLVYVFLRN